MNAEITNILKPYLKHESVREMQNYIQHGDVTTYRHSITVACVSYAIVKMLGLKVNLSVLLIGALLHDFYLYDWHDKENRPQLERLHGFSHPERAKTNAEAVFHVDEDISAVIESHMFPLTLTKVPKTKEAVVVCVADKLVSTKETCEGLRRKYELQNIGKNRTAG